MFWNILMFIYIIYNNKLSRVILISHSKNVHTRGTIFYILCTKTYERHLFSLHHMGECIVCFSFVLKKKKKKFPYEFIEHIFGTEPGGRRRGQEASMALRNIPERRHLFERKEVVRFEVTWPGSYKKLWPKTSDYPDTKKAFVSSQYKKIHIILFIQTIY